MHQSVIRDTRNTRSGLHQGRVVSFQNPSAFPVSQMRPMSGPMPGPMPSLGMPHMGMPHMGMPGMGMPHMGMPGMGMPHMGMPGMHGMQGIHGMFPMHGHPALAGMNGILGMPGNHMHAMQRMMPPMFGMPPFGLPNVNEEEMEGILDAFLSGVDDSGMNGNLRTMMFGMNGGHPLFPHLHLPNGGVSLWTTPNKADGLEALTDLLNSESSSVDGSDGD